MKRFAIAIILAAFLVSSNIASTGIADDGTLKVFWNDDLGQSLKEAALLYTGDLSPPVAVISSDRPTAWNAQVDSSITFDSIGTTADPPITYEWDFNYDGSFDPVAGYNSSSVTVLDVYSTVGPNGTYTAALRISNFYGSDIATVNYEYIPEPSTIVLVGIGILGLVAFRQHR